MEGSLCLCLHGLSAIKFPLLNFNFSSNFYQQSGQSQLTEQQLEQKFQQVFQLLQRPLTPIQPPEPPIQPPEFPIPKQMEEYETSKPTKMGPLRVIHVRPTVIGRFATAGLSEFEDHDLKHPFEEGFE